MNRTVAPSVSLSDWNISPSIDFISIFLHRGEFARAKVLPRPLRRRMFRTRYRGGTVVTVHDPEVPDIQQLIDVWPNNEIHMIEFTLDFCYLGEGDAAFRNVELFRWLSDCLSPGFSKARQRYCLELSEEERLMGKRWVYAKMPAEGVNSTLTRRWENRDQYIKNRLYIKSDDTSIRNFDWVRLEVTLNRGGCQEQEIQHLWQLVPFASNSRRALSPFFDIAAGIKPKLKRVDRFNEGTARQISAVEANEAAVVAARDGWALEGAMWAAKNGLQTLPHREANARIGKALDRLRIELSTLKLPNFSPLISFDYGKKTFKNQRVVLRPNVSL